MDKQLIGEMVADISPKMRELLLKKHLEKFKYAISAINADLAARALTVSSMYPKPSLILNAFRQVSENIRVVIVGSEPYTNDSSDGLAFSVTSGSAIPPGLAAIFKILHVEPRLRRGETSAAGSQQNGDPKMPLSEVIDGSLISWAKQGVLLLNLALTSVEGVSTAHHAIWDDYTSAILSDLAASGSKMVFILFGPRAKSKTHLIEGEHLVLTYATPSASRSFEICDVFSKCDAYLGRDRINWGGNLPDLKIILNNTSFTISLTDPKADIYVKINNPAVKAEVGILPSISNMTRAPSPAVRPIVPGDPRPPAIGTTYAFTDGGSENNGKPHCVASWAIYITDGKNVYEEYGLVPTPPVATNNRGELSAIVRALEVALLAFPGQPLCIVSDSEYSIKSITEYYAKWLATKTLGSRANIDLISVAHEKMCNFGANVKFEHIKSHTRAPVNSAVELFKWQGNAIVDQHCKTAIQKK